MGLSKSGAPRDPKPSRASAVSTRRSASELVTRWLPAESRSRRPGPVRAKAPAAMPGCRLVLSAPTDSSSALTTSPSCPTIPAIRFIRIRCSGRSFLHTPETMVAFGVLRQCSTGRAGQSRNSFSWYTISAYADCHSRKLESLSPDGRRNRSTSGMSGLVGYFANDASVIPFPDQISPRAASGRFPCPHRQFQRAHRS